MPERLYTEHPEVYDLIQSEWDYDRDVAFVEGALAGRAADGGGTSADDGRLLEVGCGTGEHTRRFVDRGFDVTAVDAHEGMLSVARGKCDARFRRGRLPDLAVGGEYDAVVAIRGVINHLPPASLRPAIRSLAAHLADGGVLAFDASPLPPEGTDPGLDVGADSGDGPSYVRVAQHVPAGDGRLDWRSVTFLPDGTAFTTNRRMTPFGDGTILAALDATGLAAAVRDGYGPGDDRSVFVATPDPAPADGGRN